MTKQHDEEELMGAIRSGDLLTVKKCVESGVNLHEYYYDYENFDQDDHVYTPLTYAAKHGHAEVVAYFLGKNVSIDEGISSGDTPLVAACCYGHTDIARRLIKHGAKINYDTNGSSVHSPLWFAVTNSNWEIVELLLQKGATLTVELRRSIQAARIKSLDEYLK